MIRNILFLLLFGFLGWYGYQYWKTHSDSAQAGGGGYICDGIKDNCLTGDAKSRYLKENSGETTDGNSEHKNTTARLAAEEAVNGTTPTIPASPTSGTSSMVAPAQGITYATPPAAGNGTFLLNGTPNAASSTQSVPVIPAPTVGLPLDAPTQDSQSANSPNGMRFSGSGSYQWYRQGDLTYRVDTTTGKSCIVYATKRQWRDPLVFQNGCGRTS